VYIKNLKFFISLGETLYEQKCHLQYQEIYTSNLKYESNLASAERGEEPVDLQNWFRGMEQEISPSKIGIVR
jgi:hypothetical protein